MKSRCGVSRQYFRGIISILEERIVKSQTKRKESRNTGTSAQGSALKPRVVPNAQAITLRFDGYDADGVQCYSFLEHLDGVDINR